MINADELLNRYKPEPPTADELRGLQLLGLGSYEIYSEKLNMIVEEASVIMAKLGISVMLHAGDLVVAIYTTQGDLVTASSGTFLHAVTGQIPIKYVMQRWRDDPSVGIKPGDIFYCNDALYGGIHNCDQFALMPIYEGEELVAWALSGVHQPETGACEPGGMPVAAKSRCDEGMRLTPIKIGENYQLREDLLEMMANMVVRAPRMQMTDVRARVSACDRVRARVEELIQEKGVLFVWGLFRKMIDTAAEGARKKIASWNDGTYRAVWFMDSIGHSSVMVKACLTAVKKGDQLDLDFSGTSPENDGSYNSFFHGSLAHVAHYLYRFAFHDLPVSTGIFEPMTVSIPKGTFLNASPDASVANSPVACGGVMTLAHLVFSKMMFDSEQRNVASAPPDNIGAGYIHSGVNQWGVPYTDMPGYLLNTEGTGGTPVQDGIDSYGFCWGVLAMAPDVEDAEAEFPVLYLFAKHFPDSCGYGKHRGGSGTQVALIQYDTPVLAWMSFNKNSKIAVGQGIFGGYPTCTQPGISIAGANIRELLANGDRRIPTSVVELLGKKVIQGDYIIESNLRKTRLLSEGDIFVCGSFGGGGYGDALEREPDEVMQDLRSGVISPWVAQNVYKVAFYPGSLDIDRDATLELREQERIDRIRRGVKYGDFEQAWLQKKPPSEILGYYGSWPDAKPVRMMIRI